MTPLMPRTSLWITTSMSACRVRPRTGMISMTLPKPPRHNAIRRVCCVLFIAPLLWPQGKDAEQQKPVGPKKPVELKKTTSPKRPEDQPKSPAGQPTAADREKAVETLKRLVTNSNYRELGFDSVAEAATATQGEPFRRYLITAGQITVFKDTDDPASVIRPGGELLIPVIAGGKVRCFITMADRGKGWRGVSFGMSAIAQALTAARSQQAAATRLPLGSFVAVDVTPLSTYLLAWRTDGKLPEDAGS